MSAPKTHIVIMGPPAGGKGTQARLLEKELKVPYLSTGDLLRAEIAAKTPFGLSIEKNVDAGKFVTDEQVMSLVSKALDQPAVQKGFIFDGFPRTLSQAKLFDQVLKDKGLKIDIVFELDVPDKYIVERVVGRYVCATCGTMYNDKFKPPRVHDVCDVCGGTKFVRRDDDTTEVATRRLKTYHELTAPIFPYYADQGLLVRLDGTQPIQTIHDQIKKVVGN